MADSVLCMFSVYFILTLAFLHVRCGFSNWNGWKYFIVTHKVIFNMTKKLTWKWFEEVELLPLGIMKPFMVLPVCVSVHLSVCGFVCLRSSLSVSLSTNHQEVNHQLSLGIRLYLHCTYLSISLWLSLCGSLSVCLSVCLFIHKSSRKSLGIRLYLCWICLHIH